MGVCTSSERYVVGAVQGADACGRSVMSHQQMLADSEMIRIPGGTFIMGSDRHLPLIHI